VVASADIKNEWCFTSIPKYACIACTGAVLPLLYLFFFSLFPTYFNFCLRTFVSNLQSKEGTLRECI